MLKLSHRRIRIQFVLLPMAFVCCATNLRESSPPLLLGDAATREQLAAGSKDHFLVVAEPLDAAFVARMREVGSYKDGCPVPPSELALVRFVHHTLSGDSAIGTLVVNRAVAADVAAIFGELYAAGFALAGAKPVEEFAGSDDRSMDADNTSAFNCRPKTPSLKPGELAPKPEYSVHSYGLAIDINPIENPYFKANSLEEWGAFRQSNQANANQPLPSALLSFCLGATANCKVLPEAGRAHLDRAPVPGVINADDVVVRAFKSRGFTWGGDWPLDDGDKVRTDTQHFEKPVPKRP